MKKIISLALVVVLALSMATVAFAGTLYSATEVLPGEKYTIGADAFKFASGKYLGVEKSGTIDADGQFVLDANGGSHSYFSSDYFTVSYKFEKGADKVEYVKFNGDGVLEIKFKANYSLEVPTISNVAFKELKVKSIKDIKATTKPATAANQINAGAKNVGDVVIGKNTEFLADLNITAYALGDLKVGYTPVKVAGSGDTFTIIDTDKLDLSQAIRITNNGYYKFKKNGNTTYRDITFSKGAAFVEVRVFDGDKKYLGTNADPNLDIVKANPDAEIEFVNFVGAPSFSASAKVEISADKDQFIYELKDGKLVKTNLKWNNESYAFTGKAVTLGSYVVSDVELKNVAASAEEKPTDSKNPNTGANDVVGVAVALAVVSLVAAGAVSLKK